jgi:hypothetical protein
MACMTLTAQPLAMATTQLARVVSPECAPGWQFEATVDRAPLRMSWVVVTDSDGKAQLRMHWLSEG